jgi:hypothetical protein
MRAVRQGDGSVAITSAGGLNSWVAGFGLISDLGKSDMVLRDTNTGAFEVYDIANNQITAAAYTSGIIAAADGAVLECRTGLWSDRTKSAGDQGGY